VKSDEQNTTKAPKHARRTTTRQQSQTSTTHSTINTTNKQPVLM
jgi:hypothetical protein